MLDTEDTIIVIVTLLLSRSTAGQFGSMENSEADNDWLGSVITTPDKYPPPSLLHGVKVQKFVPRSPPLAPVIVQSISQH